MASATTNGAIREAAQVSEVMPQAYAALNCGVKRGTHCAVRTARGAISAARIRAQGDDTERLSSTRSLPRWTSRPLKAAPRVVDQRAQFGIGRLPEFQRSRIVHRGAVTLSHLFKDLRAPEMRRGEIG